jgi:hypothetical protein
MKQIQKQIKTGLVATVVLVLGSSVWAKLPAPSDEAKAKSAEAAAKTAWSGKMDGFLLCKSQDRTVQHYKKSKGEAKPAATTTPCVDPGPFVYVPAVATAPAGAASAAAAPAVATAAAAVPAAAAKKP